MEAPASISAPPCPVRTTGPYSGAARHDLGRGCVVLTFADAQLKALAEAARAHVLDAGCLVFDRPFKLLNRECTTPRGVAFFSAKEGGAGYAYSTVVDAAHPMPPCLQAMLDYVNAMHGFGDGNKYTGVLVNYYRLRASVARACARRSILTFVPRGVSVSYARAHRTLADGISLHSDKDVAPDEDEGVFAFALGAERLVQFRPIDKNDMALCGANVASRDGEAMVMYGKGFQNRFKHGIHKRVPSGAEPAARMSFTLRRHRDKEGRAPAKRKRSAPDGGAANLQPRQLFGLA